MKVKALKDSVWEYEKPFASYVKGQVYDVSEARGEQMLTCGGDIKYAEQHVEKKHDTPLNKMHSRAKVVVKSRKKVKK